MSLTTHLRTAAVLTLAAVGCTVPASAAGASAAERPPALPSWGVGPATFAYLCANAKDRDLIPSGPCDSWRLVTADGSIFSVPEALAWEKYKDPDLVGEPGALAISPDGTRVAYHQADDDHVVVRDLSSGETWTIPYKVPRGSVGSPFTMRFVRDGSGLAITSTDSSDVPTVTFAQVEAETARRMPKGWTLLDADPASGRLTLLKSPELEDRGTFRTTDGDRVTTVKIPAKAGKHLIWGAFAARDGRAANLVPKDPPACGPDMTPVWLAVFSTRTGKMTTVKPKLPADVYRADVIDWLGREEVVAAAGRERPGKAPDAVVGSYVYAVNVSTGASRLLTKLSTTEQVYEDRLVVGGYAAAQGPVAGGKAAKPGDRGCG
ncbi:hypothetical protein [Nonomuraea jiangxiensis]|uniref:PQQ-like domain-containing protein n=1 Tax=Nonomuraea jiangxiensis TaxID=633440 RepID=A0A1G9IQV9_9ACTN|nr:hypothetical protein [Nonomuraea jiangxiensis]SDL27254.1 hypothetical protein SAMN05421869_12413 [Nonomuraea jiangxiensis]